MKKYKRIYIEITNKCNLTCPFCPGTKRSPRFMGEDLFEHVLHQIKGHSDYLYFHVMGEPLLHPKIGHFLDLCESHGYKVNITTNGWLIAKAGESIMDKPALRQVNFSLHSLEGVEDQKEIDAYLDKVFSFVNQAHQKRELLISLRLWNLSREGYNPTNSHVLGRIQQQFALPFVLEDKVIPAAGIKLAKGVYLNPALTFQWPDLNADPIPGKAFCYGLKEQVAILVDGTVVPCCLDGEGIIELGNVQVQKLEEIIDSPRAKNIVAGFSRGEPVEQLCQCCGYRDRFNN